MPASAKKGRPPSRQPVSGGPPRARSGPVPAARFFPAAGSEAVVFGGREVTLATRQRPASAAPLARCGERCLDRDFQPTLGQARLGQ